MTERARVALARLWVSLVATSLLAGCGADAIPSPSAVAASFSLPPSAAATASPGPTAIRTPAATPVAGWSRPTLVASESCGTLGGEIDAAGHSHLVATCASGLLYAATNDDGSW